MDKTQIDRRKQKEIQRWSWWKMEGFLTRWFGWSQLVLGPVLFFWCVCYCSLPQMNLEPIELKRSWAKITCRQTHVTIGTYVSGLTPDKGAMPYSVWFRRVDGKKHGLVPRNASKPNKAWQNFVLALPKWKQLDLLVALQSYWCHV